MEKIKKILLQMKKEKLDALLVSASANISYLTGYPSRDSLLLVTPRKQIFITDSRYTREATKKLKGCTVTETSGPAWKKIGELCAGLKISCLGFEERYLSYAEYKRIRKELSKDAGFCPTSGMVEELRQVKSGGEIEKIRKALAITVAAFRFAKKLLKPGMREIEVAAELERFIRFHGARAASFDIIVASGPNSSFPHHLTSERKLKANEPVLIDLGVDYQGYKSDLTRVFFLGTINSLTARIYRIVLEAKRRAIAGIKPGATAEAVDNLARGYIQEKGFGRFFGHSTGHGVGLEVHEAPHIAQKQTAGLQPGMVFTVEPAIYLPHRFGIRLEDMVLVTGKGSEVLSGSLHQ